MKEVICVVCPKGCRVQVDENTLEVLGDTFTFVYDPSEDYYFDEEGNVCQK